MIERGRKLLRLKDYDYAQSGAYFVTICVQDRMCLFGEIRDGMMVLNKAGCIIQFTWNDLIQHNTNISLDQFVVMPNHIHGIICINKIVGVGSKPTHSVQINSSNNIDGDHRAGLEPAPTQQGVPEIVRQFKTFSAKRVNKNRNIYQNMLWQRNYHDHIVRNDRDLNNIRQYIMNNPVTWNNDEYNTKTNIKK